MERLITGLALMLAFCIGFAAGYRSSAAIWEQFTSDAVARSVKADRN